MKIVHTSDWHLGQNFYRFDREDEHLFFFHQLEETLLSENPDALVVSGDIFHTIAPSTQSQRLFVDAVLRLKDAAPNTVFVFTAGNHDSAARLEAQSPLWKRQGVRLIGGSRREVNGTYCPEDYIIEIPNVGYILAVPYFYPSNFPLASKDTLRENRQSEFFQSLLSKVSNKSLPVVLMAHLAVQGCDITGHEETIIGGMEQEELNTLGQGYDYLALGHIHKPQQMTSKAYYCGSPIPVSFNENYSHYLNVVEIFVHGQLPVVKQMELRLLRQVKTVPPQGSKFEETLQLLAALDQRDNSYIRVLIDQDEPLPADAEDRIRLILEGKACRFCDIRLKPRTKEDTSKNLLKINEVEEFTRLDPMLIAKAHYLTKEKVEMSDSLSQKMQSVINAILNNKDLN